MAAVKQDARAAFLAAMAAVAVPVKLKNGATVFVRELTADDVITARRLGAQDEAADKVAGNPQDPAANLIGMARAAAAYVCDEQGNKLFDQANAQDVAALSSLGWGSLNAVLKAGDALSKEAEAKND